MTPAAPQTWTGQWVADRLEVALLPGDGDGPPLADLLGLALRRNPKRAHLLVSNLLGKHIPQRPALVHGAGTRLGERVRELLGEEAAARAVVLGYAETATGLGHSVADGLALAPYLHSTRRPVTGVRPVGGFEEEHSHATSHLLLPEDPALLDGDGPLVLVDDEFSTGNTVLNTITALHRRHPRGHYVIVALVDMRSATDRARLEEFAAGLGARIDVVSLAAGTVRLPADVLARGQALVAEHEAAGAAGATAAGSAADDSTAPAAPADSAVRTEPAVTVALVPDGAGSVAAALLPRVDLGWPAGLPDGGRHGFTPAHRARLEAALPVMAARLARHIAPDTAAAASTVRTDTPDTPDALDAPTSSSASAAPGTPAAVVSSMVQGVPSAPTPPGTPAAPVAPDDTVPPRVLVLGNEELMYTPLRLAGALRDALGDSADVRFSTTTRSPVLAVDDPGYAIRTRIVFPSHDDPADGPGERYAYNVAPGVDSTRAFDTVVAVVDSAADTPALHAPDGLLARLRAVAGRVLLTVIPSHVPSHVPSRIPSRAPDRQAPAVSRTTPRALPEPLRGPAFSSYAADEVGWLLKDLSEVTLEAPTEEREEAIQSGGAHYAESLPVEYRPTAEYQALFRSALDASAERIARAVGTVTDIVLAERGPGTVLVSLARAGTPVGILMRRWARAAHGTDLPHYTISIVRGRGIDTNALRYLADHHDPADVVFVDGWTGKGAITRELAAAVADSPPGFDPRPAVLADPGRCVETYGTRDDFLVPSACLNSTVSGLVSRTVLRADLIGPDEYHGAKFYRELAGDDLSRLFLDTVTARFEAVADAVAEDVKELSSQDRTPTWEGWATVERISEEYGIGDVNLVKPGVGETTRVLLRRVPWRVLARRGAGADLDHVRLLAAQRGVPVEEVDDLSYSCMGLIHPRYTRGATGTDGTAVVAR